MSCRIMIVNHQWLMRRRLFSTVLPIREELISVLQREKFHKEQAEKIIDAIDAAVIESYTWRAIYSVYFIFYRISRTSGQFITVKEYEKIFRAYQEGMEAHRKELQQYEATSLAALATDYDLLLAEVNRTLQRIQDEARQLESNVQLDLNLEKKRKKSLLTEIDSKSDLASKFLDTKMTEVDEKLKKVANQAMGSIIGLGAAIISGFIGYKFYINTLL